MIAGPHAFRAFRERWLTRRDELRRLHALVDGATLCDELLAELDRLGDDAANELLSLQRAAAESGYSADHLGRLLRDGKLANAGRVNSPRIRRGDLPIKARHALAPDAERSYDLDADARSLMSRRNGGANGDPNSEMR
jgi:hypothetical protein